MLHTVKELKGDAIVAQDGRIGALDDVYFDDRRWGVRYFVVDTGGWLGGRKVLISPAAVAEAGPRAQDAIEVLLTREQVRNCPDAGTERPVSRRYEMAHAAYYGYPYYWVGPYLWGAASHPVRKLPEAASARQTRERALLDEEGDAAAAEADSHLRSGAEVIGYHIEARDGSAGHVEDIAMEEGTWAVSHLVVDTRNWLPGEHVRIAPSAIEEIDWEHRRVRLRLSREEVGAAPRAVSRSAPQSQE